MTEHANFSEDLALYALDALPQNDPIRKQLESHMESCSQCRAELEELRSTSAFLALSVNMASPPADVRRRLLASIAQSRDEKEARTTDEQKTKLPMSRPWWAFAPVLFPSPAELLNCLLLNLSLLSKTIFFLITIYHFCDFFCF